MKSISCQHVIWCSELRGQLPTAIAGSVRFNISPAGIQAGQLTDRYATGGTGTTGARFSLTIREQWKDERDFLKVERSRIHSGIYTCVLALRPSRSCRNDT